MLGTSRARVLAFRVQIRDLEPAVWRGLHVRDDGTFADLHQALFSVFGWSGRASFQFEVWNPTSLETETMGTGEGQQAADQVPLRRFFGLGTDSGSYCYGSWPVRLVLEGVHTPQDLSEYPRCTGGECAAPPEECEGPEAYAAFLTGNPWFDASDFQADQIGF